MPRNSVGLYYFPFTKLVGFVILRNRQLISFMSKTGIGTLEETLARCRRKGNKLYWDNGDLEYKNFKVLPGYGRSFIRLLNDALKNLGEGCHLESL